MKKPGKSLPDTNTIIRYLVRDDEPLYLQARDFFDKVKTGSVKAVIIESVIAECIYVLTKIYKVPRNEAAASLIDILHYKGIANHDIVDCVLCMKAATAEMCLFSFDDELNKISSARSKQH